MNSTTSRCDCNPNYEGAYKKWKENNLKTKQYARKF